MNEQVLGERARGSESERHTASHLVYVLPTEILLNTS